MSNRYTKEMNMNRLFFVSYFKNGLRKWAKFYTNDETQLRETIAKHYPEWAIDYINEW